MTKSLSLCIVFLLALSACHATGPVVNCPPGQDLRGGVCLPMDTPDDPNANQPSPPPDEPTDVPQDPPPAQ